MSTLQPSGAVEQTTRRIVQYLDSENVRLTPSQVDGVRLRIIESETQETLRVLTQMLEALRGLSASDLAQSGKLDMVITALQDLKTPLQTLSEEGRLRIDEARADIANRSNFWNKALIPAVAGIGSAVVTALGAASMYYFAAG